MERSPLCAFAPWHLPLVVFLACFLATHHAVPAPPNSPRIDYVEPLPIQPQASDPAVIWVDDFDDTERQEAYAEAGGKLTESMRLGQRGKALHMLYRKGQRGSGGRKVFFGDSPAYPAKVVRKGERVDEVYWRIYVKHQAGWQGGGPAKLSRATSIAATDAWAQAMIAHVWSSGESLTLDPATGIREGRLVTTRYNDFPNLRWLGNRPASRFKLHSTEESGRWVCVEAHAKLNTPGKRDGENHLWIDGKLEAERTQLDWRGTFDDYGINAVFLEAYWNQGSPVEQSRWIDHFVISTQPIGPLVSPSTPTVMRTPHGMPLWEVEVASDAAGRAMVWRSKPVTQGLRLLINADTGQFTEDGRNELKASTTYFLRIRERASKSEPWSPWSDWHQPFRVE